MKVKMFMVYNIAASLEQYLQQREQSEAAKRVMDILKRSGL